MATTLQFEVSANGHVFGIFAASSEQAARDLCAKEAGYEDEADMVDRLKQASELVAVEVEEWAAWEDGQKDGAVSFFAPSWGYFDHAAAGARALGVDVSESFHVSRV